VSLMDLLDDYIFGPLNYVDRLEGLLKALYYQDTGVRFAIPRKGKGGKHTLQDVSQILQQYGIPIFCRTHDSKNMYFRVKKRQAAWAEYLLLNAGIELNHPLVDPRNINYAASHPPGWMPTPWAEKQPNNLPNTQAPSSSTNKGASKSESLWQEFTRGLDNLF